MAEPVVRVEGIRKSFGTIRALDNVSFEVPKRSIFGLLGPNGAGKTTLFSIAANFLQADAGRIEVLGHQARDVAELRGRMAILPQDALFQRNVPILDQLVFFSQLTGKSVAESRTEVTATLERVGLGSYKKRGVHALSHGMIKRLGLAQAFLGNPEVIFLDEPTSGLDPKNAEQIRALVRDFQSRDSTIVISSHNLGEIQDLCDTVAILDRGKVVATDTVGNLTRTGRKLDLTLSRPLTQEEGAALEALAGVRELQRVGETRFVVTMDLPDGADGDGVIASVLRTLLDAGAVPHLLREGNSLEEVFLKLTGQDEAE